MRLKKTFPITPNKQEDKVISYWRNGGVSKGSMITYLQWVRRFYQYCDLHKLNKIKECTQIGAYAFSLAYRGQRLQRSVAKKSTQKCARVAIHAWYCALKGLGLPVLQWKTEVIPIRLPSILTKYLEYRKCHRGVAPTTLARDLEIVSEFLKYLKSLRKNVKMIRILDIDSFIVKLGKRLSRRTISRHCTSLRCFFKFLQTTGSIRINLAAVVCSPYIGIEESPPRAIAWKEIRQIIKAIPRKNRIGRRDYAMLLLMAAYGLGGAELVSLRLEDIYWEKGIIKLHRPKTGNPIELPLLPAIAKAIVCYLKHGRPNHIGAREIFLTIGMPYQKISTATLRHQIRKYATMAGLNHKIFGSHLFRHSHATRQIDWGANYKVLADILGHRRLASTSVYIRVALRRLRPVSLPVPR